MGSCQLHILEEMCMEGIVRRKYKRNHFKVSTSNVVNAIKCRSKNINLLLALMEILEIKDSQHRLIFQKKYMIFF